MTAVGLAERVAAGQDCGEFPHVLDGVVLIGAAARLAAMLDRRFLDEAGWDPRTRVLSLPAEHRLLGRTVCRVEGCQNSGPFRSHGVLSVLHAPDSVGDEHGRDRRCRMPARRTRVPDVGARCRDAGACRRCGTRCCASRTPRSSACGDHRCRWSSSWPTRECGRCRRCPHARWRRALGRPTARAATATPTTNAGGQRWPPTPRWIPTGGEPANRAWPSPGR